MISVLAQPRLRRFFLAHLQSRLGTGAAYVALVLIAYQRLHASWAIALVLLADVLPGIVLSTVFGALADRVSRTRLAVTALLLSAGAFAGLAVVSSFAVTVALALVAGVGTAMLAGYSVLVSAYGAGMVLASLLCARAGNRVGLLRRLWLAGNALCATGMLASAAAPSLTRAAGTFALTGAANALIISPEMRLFQEIVPARLLGRVLGFSDTATNVALLAAFVSAGGLLTQFSTRMVFALGAVALLVLTAVAALTFHPEPRRVQAESPDAGLPALGVIADVPDAEQAYAGAY